MKTVVEKVHATRVRLVVEVPVEEWEPDREQAGTAPGCALAGFRGKVPFHPVDGQDHPARLPEAAEERLLALISAAAGEHDLMLLGRIDVEVTQDAAGTSLRFVAEADASPEIQLPELSSIVVQVDAVTIDEGDVDEQLESLRERFATTEDVSRAVAVGDVVELDLRTTVDGVAVAGACASGAPYEVGSGWLPAGVDPVVLGVDLWPAQLDGHLVGLFAGESTAVRLAVAGGEFGGKVADMAVTVTAVRQVRLPDLDDEFAALVGQFATVQRLREDVRERLVQVKKAARLRAVRTAVLRKIAAAAEVPVPEGVVRDEVAFRRRWMAAEFHRVGTTLREYLATADKTEQQLDAELRDAAVQRLCGMLLLDAFARSRGLRVSQDEIHELISQRAREAGVPAGTYARQLVRNGGRDSVLRDVRRGKALAMVMQSVTMVDHDGRPLTLADLRHGA